MSEISPVAIWGMAQRCAPGSDWRRVDRALRAIRQRRAALDAEEARWLREAEALQIWRPLGMVSAMDYMERVLGYAPRTAQDRLRVARALGDLPRLTAALAGDDLPFSAVRELTRVATPGTEAAWIAAATGKNLRQIEELVADHRPGDRPDDPPDPQARTHVVRFELAAETFALLRQARRVLDDEHAVNLSDDEFVAALCNAVLDGAPSTEFTGRAKYQIAVTVCERCRQGWQEGAGAQVAIEPAATERAMCDAQHIGSLDSAVPERAHQDIPPSTARLVWRRDGGRCRVPGCRSSRGLQIHHIIHRADGGSHDASNLCLLCSACHLAHHRGALMISGTASRLEVHRPGEGSQGRDRLADASAMARDSADAPLDACGVTWMDAGGLPSCGASERVMARDSADAPLDACGVTWMDAGRLPRGASELATALADAGAHVGAPDAGSKTACGTEVKAGSKLDAAILRTQARAALTGLGWKPAIAHAAVDAAAAVQGPETTLERLIFESLRRCPAPKA